ncbi:Site-specific DNA-methyltransferase (adenine-specific) [Halothece sp. PCC 7418]|uniref:N-6 DNA methylase n=1 Tax=Halothece sp. (strain PCC 7418) TaxID=65093 RepID=UPI0002A07BDE|nr:N-6 DNA methylase [Halothece sp. PCC 7418]AFZ45526.1 Site-specific DNA-methyltransferase (adenine-specific) [Halothece sp. PCC 7418]
MTQFEYISGIEKDLWSAADTLRSNSNYASNEYFLPVMGLIFLRHAYSRFLQVKKEIEKDLPKRGGKTRALKKEDFSQKGAIFLKPEAQFDYLVSLPDGNERANAIFQAMESIEKDYETLSGILPKSEYQNIEDDVLGQLLRLLDPKELKQLESESSKQVSGDVFGRIYEYFLMKFADMQAHDGGEFFTPFSLVSLIVNVIEPDEGTVFDPACGSGGMFVQSAKLVEESNKSLGKITFRGLEKNQTTIRLAKMNLAVHGLEGNIQQAITYYDDPLKLAGKADYVMANPPFNVDEVDAEKVENDSRLKFGLPGVNKNKKVSNGNYLWISYFYSYLNEQGRAGFVMSSQASSAGGDEAKVREALIKTGAVELIIAIRGGFFYSRSVPCELWFLNRAKPEAMQDKVLMIDARQVYRQVTRRIYDFSPEQLKNLVSIVRLYRGESDRFLGLVQGYFKQMLQEGKTCADVFLNFQEAISQFQAQIEPFLSLHNAHLEGENIVPNSSLKEENIPPNSSLEEENIPPNSSLKEENIPPNPPLKGGDIEFCNGYETLKSDCEAFTDKFLSYLTPPEAEATALNNFIEQVQALAETSRDLVKQVDLVYKLAGRVVEHGEENLKAKESEVWDTKKVKSSLKNVDASRQEFVKQLKQVRYFFQQGQWLMVRFPEGTLQDVDGLVKLVDLEELKANDWSLTPGRYVGVAPEEEEEDFDFEEALRSIHVELKDLNEEAVNLAKEIEKNFEELGI